MGGGKNRKGARNRDIDSSSQKATRYAKEAGEIYACVTRLFGGSNCEVKCVDNKTRLCVIRNKFRGRGKKDNTLAIGVWVLIGIRDWETTPENKLPKCDLLEVYSNTDKIRLKNSSENIDWNKISGIGNDSLPISEENDDIEFVMDNKHVTFAETNDIDNI